MSISLKIFLFSCFVSNFSIVLAQKSMTIAFDPLSVIALGGYEVELGYNSHKNRLALSYLSGDLSPWFGQASDFSSTSHSVLELSYSRFLKENQDGLSYGMAYAYFTDFTVVNEQRQSLEKNPSKISLKLAYAWFPFKTFPLYLEPSMTFGFFINDEDLNFSTGEAFKAKSFIGNGPLFNIGYRLNL